MKDNKGQVLVTFILLLPILLILMATITETGLLYIEKRKVDNNVKDVLRYGLDNIAKDSLELRTDMTTTLTTNISDINRLDITIKNNIITIVLSKQKKSIFKEILSKDDYEIKSSYYGYLNNGKMIVKEV